MKQLLISIALGLIGLITINSSTFAQSCYTGHKVYYAFADVINTPKYKCYGKPSSQATTYRCPSTNSCKGTYVQQEFCKEGRTVNLYYSEAECTCGCADKNFHGKSLNLLDLEPCGCDGIIGAEW